MSLELLDYRLQVFSHYQEVRESKLVPVKTAERYRQQRDSLFAEHSQSPLDKVQNENFSGLDYFPYDPAWRKLATLEVVEDKAEIEIPLRDDGLFRMHPYVKTLWPHDGQDFELTVYWIDGYGGGLFLPFRDESRHNGETYPGTRYLLNTIKGADLGLEDGKLVLDFNYAYNPSCAYNPAWDCYLAPQDNWLELPVYAGEKNLNV